MIGCYRCLKPATWIAISAARSFKSGDMVGFETPQCDDHKHGNKFRRITETMEIHDFLEHRGKSPTITEHLEFELMFTRKCLSGLIHDDEQDVELIEVFRRNITDLRMALGALYVRN